MINILSYIGMSLQSEVCLWTLLGLLRTIFDATLFKVNANLKQVWQMEMPPEISLPVQRVLRTMVSGVMLAQCFTVYVYLASYIVLLYPVFLEERPTLVLPWLLLAAIRNFLCELTSLALGLGTCVLLGPARPPCIRFVIFKLALIMPAFYIWTLIFGYYHNLKMASAFKTFPAVLPSKDLDYGLELAVRRRRTKSLQGEDQLRKKLIASLYAEQVLVTDRINTSTLTSIHESNQSLPIVSQVISNGDIISPLDGLCPMSVTSNRTMSDIGTYEDWFGSEVVVPRDTDRILEQFVIMLLRIAAYLKRENVESIKHLNSNSQVGLLRHNKGECTAMPSEETDTPPLVGNTTGRTASYLRDYPHIFGKKTDVLGVLNTPESKLTVNRSSSSQSTKSTKGVATETITPKFNDVSEQGSRDMLNNSQERKTDQNLKNIYKQIENGQVANNSTDSDGSGEIDINKTRAHTESKEIKSKNKSNPSEHILNKYKRKDSMSSNNNNDANSDRSSNSEQPKK